MVRFLRAIAVPLVLVLMIGLAGVALKRIYADPLVAQLMLGAAVGSVGVSMAARQRPSWLVAPLSVLAMLGYGVLVLWLAADKANLPDPLGKTLAEAARNGVPRLLTAMIPIEPVPDTIVVPLVAAWLAGLASAELAVRAGRTLLGYVPPMLLYAGGLYVVGPNAASATWSTAAFAAVAAVGLAVTGRTGRSQPRATADPLPGAPVPAAVRVRILAGTAAGTVAVIALVAVVAPVVASQVGTSPVDPRRYVQPPQVDSLDENPLIRISGWALNPEEILFEVRTNGGAGATPPPGTDGEANPDASNPADGADSAEGADVLRIRLAVLKDYDGVTWRVGATYRNAGRVLPAVQPRPAAVVDTVQQEVTIAGLTGRLLPAVATPQLVTGARIAYDRGSGTLIHPEGLTPGLRYTVTSVRERPDLNLLTAANVPSGDAVARVLRVGDGVPEQIRQLAEKLAMDNAAPYDRAVAIEQFLAEHYRIVADAPSGHAYPNLNFFLFGPRNGGGQRGTSEQFAASFAVLGRLMGLPTRVVVGFHSDTGTGPVRAGDAYAWPEVLFDELGWVTFDPLPKPDTEPRPIEEDFKPKTEKPTPPPTEEPPPTATPAASDSPAAAAATIDRGGVSTPALVGGVAAVLLLGLAGCLVVVIALRRALRRRRLEEGSPAQRVAGAWQETVDALHLAGWPVAGHLSATEVATHAPGVPADAAAVRPPVPPIDDLAALVNLAAFAPGETSETQARRAGAQAMAYGAALRAGLPWWRRALWSLHPGPLRWRR